MNLITILAHFTYAKFLDLLFETRISTYKAISADIIRNAHERRAEAIRSIQECQECLLGSIQHYGMALKLGQKHVYQALPRLLAMWLEFTALEGKDATDLNGKFMSILFRFPCITCLTL
jgi:hypothetical protein